MLFYGGSGSGKDHLLSYLVHSVVMEIQGPISIDWKVASESKQMYRNAYLKVLSDPVLSGLELRYSNQIDTFELIDHAWRNNQPIWLSINSEDRAQLDSMVGVQIADRIVDGAFTLFFDWESFRKPRELRAPFQTARLRYPMPAGRQIDAGPTPPVTEVERYRWMLERNR